MFQETILPNIAFIGGGGELAYWLELKDLFEYYNIRFPYWYYVIRSYWWKRNGRIKLIN
jgi:uncharacterized protein YllA (UPF0747 family)